MTLTPNTFICYIKLSHWQQEHQTQNNFLFTFRKSAKSFKIFDLDKAYRLQLSNIIYSIRIQSCEPISKDGTGNSNDSSNSSETDSSSEEQQASTQTESGKDLSSLSAISDVRFFEIAKKMDGNKFLAKCKLCPNKLISAQMNATSNLLD